MSWTTYDPHTGIKEIETYDPDKNALIVHKQEDVSALLDRNAELANTGATDSGIKKGLWCYASIPLTVQYELLSKYGLNIMRKDHTDAIFDVINRDYPKLKTTQKTHSRTRKLGRKPVTLPGLGSSLKSI